MIDIREILCPIDFSDFSRRALDHAVRIAQWYDSHITLLHVYNVLPVAAYTSAGDKLPPAPRLCADREALLTSLQEFAAAEAPASVPIACDAAEGDVAAAILAKADALPSDLIVIGTHGRSGFERLILGSVTEKVLRKAACPILTVPANAPDAVPLPVFKRIVCAVDFSDCSIRALSYAMSLAQEADAQLTLVHVIELPPEIPVDQHDSMLGARRSLREYIAAAAADRGERLASAVPDSVRAYCTVDTVLPTGKPYPEILRVATEREADLIVLGIHGRGAVDRWFFGSTTDHVIREASCAVLTLRSS